MTTGGQDPLFLSRDQIQRWLDEGRKALPTLLVHCAHCGGAVTLHESNWPLAGLAHDGTTVVRPDGAPRPVQTWLCPHCKGKNTGGFPTMLAFVSKGHGADNPE